MIKSATRSGWIGFAPGHCMSKQLEPINAEIHLIMVQVHRRGSECTASNCLVDVGPQGVFDLLLPDLAQHFHRVGANLSAQIRYDLLLRNRQLPDEVSLECGASERYKQALRLQYQTSSHDLHTVDRMSGGREIDRHPRITGPILHVLQHVIDLALRQAFRKLEKLHSRIDRIKDAADQDRAPRDLSSKLGGERLNIFECKIGPWTGAVEKELDQHSRRSP